MRWFWQKKPVAPIQPAIGWKPLAVPTPASTLAVAVAPIPAPEAPQENTVMNIFSKIDSAAHTFAAWAEKELGVLVKAQPEIAQVTDTIIKYVGGALSIVLSATGNMAGGAIVSSVVTQAQSDITALSGLVTDFGATPTAASIATAIATNIGALLTGAHVTDPTSVSAAKAVVANLSNLALALTNSIVPPPPPPATILVPVASIPEHVAPVA